MTVTGTPGIDLEVGGAPRRAGYDADASGAASTAGATSTVLHFAYPVQADDVDTDGVTVPADAIAVAPLVPGAAIDYRDGSGAATLGHAGLGPLAGHKVKDRPHVTGLAMVSEPGADGLYGAGEEIVLEVAFSEAVAPGGDGVELALDLGGVERAAGAAAAGGADTGVRFAYRVQAADRAAGGVQVAEHGLRAVGAGTLRGAGERDAYLGHAAAAWPGHPVDGGGALAVAVTSAPANTTDYLPGETITVTATFGRAVTVTGTPSIGLELGGETRRAGYEAGASTATALAFTYAVTPADVDTDGIGVPADALAFDGGAFDGGAAIDWADGSGAATRRHAGVGPLAGHKVKDRPYVTGIALVSDPGADGIYTAGEELAVEVTFNERINSVQSGYPGAPHAGGGRRGADRGFVPRRSP